jgi:phthiocerol/phenolphthiocerol synthesis type-I polyketide synthase E
VRGNGTNLNCFGFNSGPILISGDPKRHSDSEATFLLNQTEFAQPAIFAVSYATAKLWESLGVHPSGMIGHSIGEFVAACLAGVFRLEDITALVVIRGRLMRGMPRGSMLAVPPAATAIPVDLDTDISVAVENSPTLTVLAGPDDAIGVQEARLRAGGIECQRLHTSHAFHSAMMDPIVQPFIDAVRAANPQRPQIAYESNVTGTWINPQDATDPTFWARHLREPVKFWSGVSALRQNAGAIFIEMGPGRTLTIY